MQVLQILLNSWKVQKSVRHLKTLKQIKKTVNRQTNYCKTFKFKFFNNKCLVPTSAQWRVSRHLFEFYINIMKHYDEKK